MTFVLYPMTTRSAALDRSSSSRLLLLLRLSTASLVLILHLPALTSSICPDGYLLPNCTKQCPPGLHGNNCSSTCPGTCLNFTCEPTTGSCLRCRAGFTGMTCMRPCHAGRFGADCAQTCSTQCDAETCNAFSGFCLKCLNGYTGKTCQDPPVSERKAEADEAEAEVDQKANEVLLIFLATVGILIVPACFVVVFLPRVRKKIQKMRSRLWRGGGQFSSAGGGGGGGGKRTLFTTADGEDPMIYPKEEEEEGEAEMSFRHGRWLKDASSTSDNLKGEKRRTGRSTTSLFSACYNFSADEKVGANSSPWDPSGGGWLDERRLRRPIYAPKRLKRPRGTGYVSDSVTTFDYDDDNDNDDDDEARRKGRATTRTTKKSGGKMMKTTSSKQQRRGRRSTSQSISHVSASTSPPSLRSLPEVTNHERLWGSVSAKRVTDPYWDHVKDSQFPRDWDHKNKKKTGPPDRLQGNFSATKRSSEQSRQRLPTASAEGGGLFPPRERLRVDKCTEASRPAVVSPSSSKERAGDMRGEGGEKRLEETRSLIEEKDTSPNAKKSDRRACQGDTRPNHSEMTKCHSPPNYFPDVRSMSLSEKCQYDWSLVGYTESRTVSVSVGDSSASPYQSTTRPLHGDEGRKGNYQPRHNRNERVRTPYTFLTGVQSVASVGRLASILSAYFSRSRHRFQSKAQPTSSPQATVRDDDDDEERCNELSTSQRFTSVREPDQSAKVESLQVVDERRNGRASSPSNDGNNEGDGRAMLPSKEETIKRRGASLPVFLQSSSSSSPVVVAKLRRTRYDSDIGGLGITTVADDGSGVGLREEVVARHSLQVQASLSSPCLVKVKATGDEGRLAYHPVSETSSRSSIQRDGGHLQEQGGGWFARPTSGTYEVRLGGRPKDGYPSPRASSRPGKIYLTTNPSPVRTELDERTTSEEDAAAIFVTSVLPDMNIQLPNLEQDRVVGTFLEHGRQEYGLPQRIVDVDQDDSILCRETIRRSEHAVEIEACLLGGSSSRTVSEQHGRGKGEFAIPPYGDVLRHAQGNLDPERSPQMSQMVTTTLDTALSPWEDEEAPAFLCDLIGQGEELNRDVLSINCNQPIVTRTGRDRYKISRDDDGRAFEERFPSRQEDLYPWEISCNQLPFNGTTPTPRLNLQRAIPPVNAGFGPSQLQSFLVNPNGEDDTPATFSGQDASPGFLSPVSQPPIHYSAKPASVNSADFYLGRVSQMIASTTPSTEGVSPYMSLSQQDPGYLSQESRPPTSSQTTLEIGEPFDSSSRHRAVAPFPMLPFETEVAPAPAPEYLPVDAIVSINSYPITVENMSPPSRRRLPRDSDSLAHNLESSSSAREKFHNKSSSPSRVASRNTMTPLTENCASEGFEGACLSTSPLSPQLSDSSPERVVVAAVPGTATTSYSKDAKGRKQAAGRMENECTNHCRARNDVEEEDDDEDSSSTGEEEDDEEEESDEEEEEQEEEDEEELEEDTEEEETTELQMVDAQTWMEAGDLEQAQNTESILETSKGKDFSENTESEQTEFRTKQLKDNKTKLSNSKTKLSHSKTKSTESKATMPDSKSKLTESRMQQSDSKTRSSDLKNKASYSRPRLKSSKTNVPESPSIPSPNSMTGNGNRKFFGSSKESSKGTEKPLAANVTSSKIPGKSQQQQAEDSEVPSYTTESGTSQDEAKINRSSGTTSFQPKDEPTTSPEKNDQLVSYSYPTPSLLEDWVSVPPSHVRRRTSDATSARMSSDGSETTETTSVAGKQAPIFPQQQQQQQQQRKVVRGGDKKRQISCIASDTVTNLLADAGGAGSHHGSNVSSTQGPAAAAAATGTAARADRRWDDRLDGDNPEVGVDDDDDEGRGGSKSIAASVMTDDCSRLRRNEVTRKSSAEESPVSHNNRHGRVVVDELDGNHGNQIKRNDVPRKTNNDYYSGDGDGFNEGFAIGGEHGGAHGNGLGNDGLFRPETNGHGTHDNQVGSGVTVDKLDCHGSPIESHHRSFKKTDEDRSRFNSTGRDGVARDRDEYSCHGNNVGRAMIGEAGSHGNQIERYDAPKKLDEQRNHGCDVVTMQRDKYGCQGNRFERVVNSESGSSHGNQIIEHRGEPRWMDERRSNGHDWMTWERDDEYSCHGGHNKQGRVVIDESESHGGGNEVEGCRDAPRKAEEQQRSHRSDGVTRQRDEYGSRCFGNKTGRVVIDVSGSHDYLIEADDRSLSKTTYEQRSYGFDRVPPMQRGENSCHGNQIERVVVMEESGRHVNHEEQQRKIDEHCSHGNRPERVVIDEYNNEGECFRRADVPRQADDYGSYGNNRPTRDAVVKGRKFDQYGFLDDRYPPEPGTRNPESYNGSHGGERLPFEAFSSRQHCCSDSSRSFGKSLVVEPDATARGKGEYATTGSPLNNTTRPAGGSCGGGERRMIVIDDLGIGHVGRQPLVELEGGSAGRESDCYYREDPAKRQLVTPDARQETHFDKPRPPHANGHIQLLPREPMVPRRWHEQAASLPSASASASPVAVAAGAVVADDEDEGDDDNNETQASGRSLPFQQTAVPVTARREDECCFGAPQDASLVTSVDTFTCSADNYGNCDSRDAVTFRVDDFRVDLQQQGFGVTTTTKTTKTTTATATTRTDTCRIDELSAPASLPPPASDEVRTSQQLPSAESHQPAPPETSTSSEENRTFVCGADTEPCLLQDGKMNRGGRSDLLLKNEVETDVSELTTQEDKASPDETEQLQGELLLDLGASSDLTVHGKASQDASGSHGTEMDNDYDDDEDDVEEDEEEEEAEEEEYGDEEDEEDGDKDEEEEDGDEDDLEVGESEDSDEFQDALSFSCLTRKSREHSVPRKDTKLYPSNVNSYNTIYISSAESLYKTVNTVSNTRTNNDALETTETEAADKLYSCIGWVGGEETRRGGEVGTRRRTGAGGGGGIAGGGERMGGGGVGGGGGGGRGVDGGENETFRVGNRSVKIIRRKPKEGAAVTAAAHESYEKRRREEEGEPCVLKSPKEKSPCHPTEEDRDFDEKTKSRSALKLKRVKPRGLASGDVKQTSLEPAEEPCEFLVMRCTRLGASSSKSRRADRKSSSAQHHREARQKDTTHHSGSRQREPRGDTRHTKSFIDARTTLPNEENRRDIITQTKKGARKTEPREDTRTMIKANRDIRDTEPHEESRHTERPQGDVRKTDPPDATSNTQRALLEARSNRKIELRKAESHRETRQMAKAEKRIELESSISTPSTTATGKEALALSAAKRQSREPPPDSGVRGDKERRSRTSRDGRGVEQPRHVRSSSSDRAPRERTCPSSLDQKHLDGVLRANFNLDHRFESLGDAATSGPNPSRQRQHQDADDDDGSDNIEPSDDGPPPSKKATDQQRDSRVCAPSASSSVDPNRHPSSSLGLTLTPAASRKRTSNAEEAATRAALDLEEMEGRSKNRILLSVAKAGGGGSRKTGQPSHLQSQSQPHSHSHSHAHSHSRRKPSESDHRR